LDCGGKRSATPRCFESNPEGGVALRFPPQSKISRLDSKRAMEIEFL
jgi:hypothetical protein